MLQNIEIMNTFLLVVVHYNSYSLLVPVHAFFPECYHLKFSCLFLTFSPCSVLPFNSLCLEMRVS